MSLFKVKIPEDAAADSLAPGKEIEVPVNLVTMPDGYVDSKQLRDNYVAKKHAEAEIKRRVDAAKTQAREDLIEDDEFWRQLANERQIPLDEDGNLKLPDDKGMSAEELQQQISAAQEATKQRLTEKLVKPLQTKLEERDSRIGKLLEEKLHGEILESARKLGVKPELLERLDDAPLNATPIIAQIRHRFDYDDEYDMWAVKAGPDRFEVNTNDDTGSRPYTGPFEFLQSLYENEKTRPRFFADKRISDGDSTPQDRSTNGVNTDGKKVSEMADDERVNWARQFRP